MKIYYFKLRAFMVTWIMRLIPRNAPVVYAGPGSALTLAKQVSVLGFHRILIVTDEFLGNSGILDDIKATLTRTDVAFTIFDGVLPDPSFDQVQAGEALLRAQGCTAVMAVGGGSVLDASKMIALLHTNPGNLKSFDGIQKAKYPPLPLLVIPTTAGTGSETTLAAIITDPISHRKTVVIDSKIIPAYIALDAEIMKGMPPGITAATGMDALTHAVESYLSTASTDSTELQAKAAIKLIFSSLTRAWHDGNDMQARDNMAMAAFYAGAAFSKTSVGFVHGIAHQLGRVCQTPHGNANAMVLPEVLSAYGSCIHPRLADLAVLTGLGEKAEGAAALSARFIQAIIDMREEMELPLKPRGLQTSHVAEIVADAIAEAGELYPVPRYLSEAELTGIVRELVAAP